MTLTLSLAPLALQRGATDTITVTLTNTNPYPVTLSVGGCPLLYYVVNARGDTVVPSGGDWYCTEIISSVTLAPGGRQTQTFLWESAPFGAGIYTVRVTFTSADLKLETSRTLVALL